MRGKKQERLFELPPQDSSLFEKRLTGQGIQYIAGVDEVGRGCLAGPVMAAAVILPVPCLIEGITDSKKLTPKKRELFYDIIQKEAIAVGFGSVDHGEIDRINILNATLKAMQQAVANLSITPGYLLIDGSHAIASSIPQLAIPKGDFLSVTIGAASIMAKVKRDRMMADLEDEYSQFSFSIHKGYGTAKHLKELREHGPSPIHRRTFRGVCN